jgi:hypothetical protein
MPGGKKSGTFPIYFCFGRVKLYLLGYNGRHVNIKSYFGIKTIVFFFSLQSVRTYSSSSSDSSKSSRKLLIGLAVRQMKYASGLYPSSELFIKLSTRRFGD